MCRLYLLYTFFGIEQLAESELICHKNTFFINSIKSITYSLVNSCGSIKFQDSVV